jgi:hypothetical protein
MTNIIDLNRKRAVRKDDIDVMLGQRIFELCDELLDEGHDDFEAVINALLRTAASLLEAAEGQRPEMFLGLAADVARLFWSEEEATP